jgi:glutamate-1-semialdehyde 2,1-aminomutase
MQRLAPLGDTYQAGTLSGNPVAMAAGLTTLDILVRESGWERLEQIGAQLERSLLPVLRDAAFPIHFVRSGSLFWMSFHEQAAPRNAASMTSESVARYSTLFRAMLDRGVYLPPSAYEACFLSLAHTSSDIEQFTRAMRESLSTLK